MGVETSLSPLDLKPRRHHGAIHVDRQTPHAGLANRARRDQCVHPLQPGQMSRVELGEPPAHRARRRQPPQPAKPQDDRITIEREQVAKPSPTTDQQRQNHQHHRRHTEVAPRHEASEFSPQHPDQPDHAEVSSYELQPGVRRQPFVLETQLQVPVDPPPQIRSSFRPRFSVGLTSVSTQERRTSALAPWLRYYNGRRPHRSLE